MGWVGNRPVPSEGQWRAPGSLTAGLGWCHLDPAAFRICEQSHRIGPKTPPKVVGPDFDVQTPSNCSLTALSRRGANPRGVVGFVSAAGDPRFITGTLGGHRSYRAISGNCHRGGLGMDGGTRVIPRTIGKKHTLTRLGAGHAPWLRVRASYPKPCNPFPHFLYEVQPTCFDPGQVPNLDRGRVVVQPVVDRLQADPKHFGCLPLVPAEMLQRGQD